jgi:hypothetical protein
MVVLRAMDRMELGALPQPTVTARGRIKSL